MKLRSIIVEDEQNSQELLLNLLTNYCPEVEILGLAASVSEATKLIHTHLPDLVFLDIELQDGMGFDLFEKFQEFDFITIFITGYEQFGIKAIKHSAVDYLLKPFSIPELQKAVSRAQLRLKPWNILKQLEVAPKSTSVEVAINNLVLSGNKTSKIIPCDQITSLSADDPYCRLLLKDGTKILVQSGLNKIKDLLPDYFFKIHRSHIINLYEVKEWDKGRGGNLLLSNDKQLPISYRMKKDFIQAVHQFNKSDSESS